MPLPRLLLFVLMSGAPAVAPAQEAMENPTALADTGGAVVHYQLPTDGPLPRTYLVTLAVTDPRRPDWIVSNFATDVVRTVTTQNQGRFAETWDGLNENGLPVPPGRYGVKGICMPAQKWAVDGQYHAVIPKLVATAGSWAGTPAEDRRPQQVVGDPVGAPLRDVDVADGGIGAVAFGYLENGRNFFLTDFTRPIGYGQILAGYESGLFAGASSTCTDGHIIWSFSADGGPKFIGRADGKPFGHQHANRDNVYAPDGWVHALAAWPHAGRTVVFEAEGGRILTPPHGDYVESDDQRIDRVRALDGGDASERAQWSVAHPLGLAVRDGRLYILRGSGDDYEVLSLALEDGWERRSPALLFRVPAGLKPFDLEVDHRGRLYLSDPGANQVDQFDAQGRLLRIFGRGGPPAEGRYDPQSLLAPEKLACWTDAQGQTRLLVVEMAGPNRLSEWSGDTGALLREWVTPQTRANDGYALDPRHPDLAYVLGQRDTLVRWKIDYATGTWTTDAVWTHIGPSGVDGRLLQPLGRPRVIYRGDDAYIAFARGYLLYHVEGDRLRACAGVLADSTAPGSSHAWLWSDRNGDGQVQDGELSPVHAPPGTFRYFGEAWFDDLALVCIGQNTPDIWRLAPRGFDARGTPAYDPADWRKLLTDEIFTARQAGHATALAGGNELADAFNSDWAMIVPAGDGYYVSARSGPDLSANQSSQYKLSRYEPGPGGFTQRWRVGQVALAGTARPGEVYGPMFVSAPLNGLIGVIDNSRAGVVLYNEDGLCVDTVFPDDHLVSFDQMGAYWQPGEFFAGQVYANQDDGKIYFAMGKEMPQLFAAQGWSLSKNPVHAITTLDSTVELEAREIGTPPAAALAVRGGAAAAQVARLAPATGGAPALDGSMRGWEAGDPVRLGDGADHTVEVRCLYDPDHLYLRWHARLGRGVKIGPLDLPEHFFAHDRGADTMSLYLQGDPHAPPAAGSPDGRPGDARFVFGLAQRNGAVQPIVLGMYATWSGSAATPVTYRTPAGGRAAFAHVGLVPGVRAGYALDADGQGFVLAAALPRAALPGAPRLDGWRTEGNFDANFGGHDRFWWSNADGSASRETFDEPTEARFYPGAWSPLQAGPLRDLPIRSWMAIGPFGSPAVDALDYDRDRDRIVRLLTGASFPPDTTRDFQASFDGPLTHTRAAQRRLSWRAGEMTGDQIDLAQTLGWPASNDEGTAYLVTHIEAPRAVDLTLVMTRPDAQEVMRGWLNGHSLPVKIESPVATRLDESQPLHLRAGRNELVLRRDLIWGQMTFGATLKADPVVLWQLRISGER